ncbi:MAG: DNA mismatch repair protein MutS, partial [Butyricicoccus sp.]|nr:DNA mismatch repair protein MutS [Butyricicoccus sp.]
ELESGARAPEPAARGERETAQISLGELGADEVSRRLKMTELNTLTPIEALNLLYELKKKVEEC